MTENIAADQRPVNVAVIGAGAWARTCHLPVLARHPEVRLVAVSDLDPERAAAAAREFDIARVTDDWRSIFEAPVDACVIASPAVAHYEQCVAAIDAGAHVLLEKPMVLRLRDAEHLVALAEAAGREIVVSFGWNYSEPFRAAQALLCDPGVGRIEHISIHMASGTRDLLTGKSLSSTGNDDIPATARTWIDPAVSGGGYGQAQLPHALGVALGITGESVVEATAYPAGPPGPVEAYLAFGGRLRGGGSIAVSGASFHAGLSLNRHQLEIRVFGSQGNLLVDFERDELRLDRPDGTRIVRLEPGAGRYDGRGPAAALVDVALGRRQSTPSPGELGARTVGALELAYRSITATVT